MLAAGKLRVWLCPAVGGAVARFDFGAGDGAWPVLRPSRMPLQSVLDAASFPLVPFVNRIRGGAFSFRGEGVRLEPNMAGDASPLHGQGWLGAWTVERSGAASAELAFAHEAGEWPWAYCAHQYFALDGEGLTIQLDCRNSSDRPMPCGLGQHPYFPCGPATLIDTEVTHAWTIDAAVLPVAKVPAEGRFDLRQRLVCGQGLDHGFAGWGGSATISDPAWPVAIRLRSDDADFFQLYSPADGGLFVAEPVTHANAALNAPEALWPELGLRVLAPGEAMTLTMRFDVIPA